MTGTNGTVPPSLTLALQAIAKLWEGGFAKLNRSGMMAALSAHNEIEEARVSQKTGPFYRHFLPLRKELLGLLADNYRRYFKLALAHPRQAGRDPDKWAWGQLQPAVGTALEWIRDWYMLACDGENQSVRVQRIGTIEYAARQTVSLPIPTNLLSFPSPESWRAPAWLFSISQAYVGIGPLKTKHVPATDTEEKLGAAHTRLLLKGARRVFLRELGAAIETVRNEEIAVAGAIPAETVSVQMGGPTKHKGSKHGTKG
jgi:hypothetical protein